jgi:hypothetical protein
MTWHIWVTWAHVCVPRAVGERRGGAGHVVWRGADVGSGRSCDHTAGGRREDPVNTDVPPRGGPTAHVCGVRPSFCPPICRPVCLCACMALRFDAFSSSQSTSEIESAHYCSSTAAAMQQHSNTIQQADPATLTIGPWCMVCLPVSFCVVSADCLDPSVIKDASTVPPTYYKSFQRSG